MKTIETNWSEDEFKAYILLYAANCGHIEGVDEKAYILSKVNKDVYQKIHRELDKDNDYQSIQKIISNIKKFNYSKNELQKITTEIKELFLADDTFESIEQEIYMMLKKIINQ